MTSSPDNTLEESWIALSRLEDLETTILDASPEELVGLHSKLEALVDNLPKQIKSLISQEVNKAEQKLLAKMTFDCKTVDYQGEQWNAILVKKLKNITFEQDEDIPNGAWGKNSLKKDIREEILDILRWPYNKRPVRLTQSEALRQQRATDILNLIKSVIPEEQTVYGGEIRDHESTGYNRAIKDIKSKLIDGSKNNGK